MNEIPSSVTETSTVTGAASKSQDDENSHSEHERQGTGVSSDTAINATSPTTFVLKAPNTNSKLILQNMEEVLNSVKKKHRQKHKRKKEQKRLAQLAKAEAIAGTEAMEASSSAESRSKLPLREHSVQENGQSCKAAKTKTRRSPFKFSTPVAHNESILKHFQRTPKKEDADVQQEIIVDLEGDSQGNNLKMSITKPTNAFELMMNARNRSIGDNANGQAVVCLEEKSENTTDVKRKLMLQEWADRKGAIKRKQDEEMRAAYVEHQLEQRAKRLRKMLTHSPEKNDATPKRQRSTKQNKRRKSLHKRMQRLSSDDSNESIEVDGETLKFLSKLNSPTKKPDSLLGYFPKSETTQTAAVSEIKLEMSARNGTPTASGNKARRKAKQTVTKEKESVLVDNEENMATDALTPCVRSRRSCAGKARYVYDNDSSPTKIVKKVSSNRSVKTATTTDSTNATQEIIVLDDSSTTITPGTPITPTVSKSSKKLCVTPLTTKLAPVFIRQMPKPSLDPQVLQARAEFLRSGMPEILQQEKARQRKATQYYENKYVHFPSIAHVHQLTADELDKLSQKTPLKIKLRKVVEGDDKEVVSPLCGKRKSRANNFSVFTDCTETDYLRRWRTELEFRPLAIVENKRNIVKVWKSEYDRFPTFKCFNQMCEKYRYFRAIDTTQDTQQVCESFVVTRGTRRSMEARKLKEDEENGEVNEIKPNAAAPNGELLFNDKYKPQLFEQILVNIPPVQQLRDFLANWTSATAAMKAEGSNAQRKTLNDSTECFVNEASNSSSTSVSNTMVLLGPSSSGKTNAVYALANDMNFNVLEINAGMKRTGKKLLQDLQEATQSHQMIKQSMNKKTRRRHRRKSGGSDATHDHLDANERKSLILIEDADILFEQTDAGFVDAIYTLAASTKRPVIIVATDPNCAHLQRLMQQNKIVFQAPNVLNICKFLSILALIENCPIHLDDLISLYVFNKKNLRKTLLELQFFIQSGGDRSEHAIPKQETPTKPVTATATKPDETTTDAVAAATGTTFHASPTKHSLEEEANETSAQDEQLGKQKQSAGSDKCLPRSYYMHSSLFEFYTRAQNRKLRIPYPVDFQLLRLNLKDLFYASDKLKYFNKSEYMQGNALPNSNNKSTKRKTRSPKKAWLASNAHDKDMPMGAPLETLCDFYENISTAALLGGRQTSEDHKDRLLPNLVEDIVHTIVENSLMVNLQAKSYPYNLFDAPVQSYTLCDQLIGNIQLRSHSVRSLDYEPAVREIYRSEKQRAYSERRSSRFYHYMRNCTLNGNNYTMKQCESICEILQEQPTSASSSAICAATTT